MMSRFNRLTTQAASDGFFLNLSWVTLRLATPIMAETKTRFVNIDSSYCSATREHAATVDPEGPLIDFSREAKLAHVYSTGELGWVIM